MHWALLLSIENDDRILRPHGSSGAGRNPRLVGFGGPWGRRFGNLVLLALRLLKSVNASLVGAHNLNVVPSGF